MIRRRARAGTPTPRPLDLTIRLVPRQRPAATATGAGTCSPSVTGIQWCLYADPLYTLVSDGGTPPVYTMTPTTEEPACSSDDIAISLSGGYVPTDQDGYYVFSLIGDSCGDPVEWSYQFAEDATPTWSDKFAPYVAGDVLIVPVSGSSTYARGVATIYAMIGGQTFGPITITLASSYP